MSSHVYVDTSNEKTTYVQATMPQDWRVKVGTLWSDTSVLAHKRCTSIAPLTFVSTEGTAGAHAASHVDGGDQITTFGTSTRGLVPSSGGGTTNFLRADASWAAPAGSGGADESARFLAFMGMFNRGL